MAARVRLAALSLTLAAGSAVAQIREPDKLPPTVVQAPKPPEVRTPRPEVLHPFDHRAVDARRLNGSWQVFHAGFPFKDTANDGDAAADTARVLRELAANQWAVVGNPKPLVEYGLLDGKAPTSTGNPPRQIAFEPKSLRTEQTRGAWWVRDDANLLLSAGSNMRDAEQAVAVARKYGFNRLGVVGRTDPVFVYFCKSDGSAPVNPAGAMVPPGRGGILVPGGGQVGEQIALDAKKLEVRREVGEYVLAHGFDVLARFGADEWAARDAMKYVAGGRFTDFCRIGGVAFLLATGNPVRSTPYSATATAFDAGGLAAREWSGKWWVGDKLGKPLFACASKEEAEQAAKLIRGFGFDALCQFGRPGAAGTNGLKLLVKTR